MAGALPAALLAAWVGYGQIKTNREKLRWDLYQRRFRVFEFAVRDYQTLLESPTLDTQEAKEIQRQFIEVKLESQFLFRSGSRIQQIMDSIDTDAAIVVGIRRMFKAGNRGLPPPLVAEEDEKVIKALGDIGKAIPDLQEALSEYLSFESVERPRRYLIGGRLSELINEFQLLIAKSARTITGLFSS
ncbi:hypothetical protein [Salinisphaera hydrothermalis]|uniref:Uncharacterized protein n=1 Tax=Salinisphaera hydrothermalis (strain C41B8) TaxID=1304275 RepID=A0A084IGU2_SALHC|nr:hypothetical protein [Salinisphaera hydrothermalis]KEZ75926.1 hypothetical protein C41B8_17621 [Salinisphaera hydrothermalis C41B8]